MAKKSFKANPAMNFISQESIDKVDRDLEDKPAESLPSKGKAEPPEGYRRNPEYIETKSKRVQLLMQPSLYSTIKDLAEKENVSVNEFIHNALKEYVR